MTTDYNAPRSDSLGTELGQSVPIGRNRRVSLAIGGNHKSMTQKDLWRFSPVGLVG